MSDEHDAWLAQFGVDVRGILDRIRDAASGGASGAANPGEGTGARIEHAADSKHGGGRDQPVTATASTASHDRSRHAKAHDRAAKTPKETYNNYVALVNGINFLVQHRKKPGKLDVSPSDEQDLLPRHRDVLMEFHSALHLVEDDPDRALTFWDRVLPALTAELKKSLASGFGSADISDATEQLKWVDKYVFVPAAYFAAKRDAKASSGIEAPDAAYMAEKLTKAEEELKQAKTLQEKAKEASEVFAKSHKLAGNLGKLAELDAPKEVSKIIDLVMLPGTIEKKLELARQNGIATTAVELLGKITGATGTLVKNVGLVGEKVIEARKAFLLAKDASAVSSAAIQELEQAAGSFAKLAKLGKTLGTAASYAAVIADGFKLVSALRDGSFEKALEAAGSLAVDAAPLLLGPEVAGPLGVTVLIIQAELEVFRGAAAMIRWCKDETVRKAALDFVQQCTILAENGGYDLVADWVILLDPARSRLHGPTLAMAKKEAAQVSKGLRALSTHLTSTSSDAIGAYPKVVEALGDRARSALNNAYGGDEDMIPMLADQIADVFHGANTMAKYVKETYTN